jgi:hypothetical protein
LITGHIFERYRQEQRAIISEASEDTHVARLDRINSFYNEIDKLFVLDMRVDRKMSLWWRTELLSRANAALTRIAKKVVNR